nr:unnamed protein product [Digitaria exilis]
MDKRCFFMVMLDEDFKNGLIIPKRFAENVGGQISERIKLKVPDGETYDIDVAKKHNEVLLQSGWALFANAYEMEQGDALVFGYCGDSHFQVQIFSPSTCEKELSCFPIYSVPCVQESITSHDTHLQSPGTERMNKGCTICKGCIANHYWHHMGDKDRCFIKVMMSNFKEKLTMPKEFVANVGGQIPEEVQLQVPNAEDVNTKEPFNSVVFQKSWLVFPMGCNMTSEQKTKIDSLEKNIKPQVPLYITAMDMTSVSVGYLIFPSRFVADHLDSKLHEITFVRPNKKDKWCVKYYHTRDAQGVRNYNFSMFVQDNRLRQGDICVFELMKGARRVTMTVHVIRKVDGRFVLVG